MWRYRAAGVGARQDGMFMCVFVRAVTNQQRGVWASNPQELQRLHPTRGFWELDGFDKRLVLERIEEDAPVPRDKEAQTKRQHQTWHDQPREKRLNSLHRCLLLLSPAPLTCTCHPQASACCHGTLQSTLRQGALGRLEQSVNVSECALVCAFVYIHTSNFRCCPSPPKSPSSSSLCARPTDLGVKLLCQHVNLLLEKVHRVLKALDLLFQLCHFLVTRTRTAAFAAIAASCAAHSLCVRCARSRCFAHGC